MRSAWVALGLLALIVARASAQEKEQEQEQEEEKTLSQQIADGKYGLIQRELHAEAPARPGILSYARNPDVPRDTADTLGGLEPRDIWLAEDHVLVLRGGAFPRDDRNRSRATADWPPIDAYEAPPRQVKIPARPRVPPPFPVQLRDGAPPLLLGPNGTALTLPLNLTYFAGNFSPGDLLPPPGYNVSSSPPPFPYPPPGNGSFFAPPFPPPPSGNVSTGNGPYFLPPFPGLPYPPTENGTLPPFYPPLPPGAAILPPPDNLTDFYDEDDPSIYYPPPYDFFYPRDNSTEVPPGPLVPGIVLPPPLNFFAPLVDTTTTTTTTTTTAAPPTPTTVHKPPASKQRPSQHGAAEISNDIGPTATPAPQYVAPPNRPLRVEITHGGQSPLRAPAVYDENLVIPAREYDVRTVVFPTEAPISYNVAPVTDIVVHLKAPHHAFKKQHHRKPQVAPQYYELPRDAYTSDRVLFQKPVYVLEYDSRQLEGRTPSSKDIPLVSPYYDNNENRIPSTPRPYLGVSPNPKASFYYYEEPSSTTGRVSQHYYQLPKQLTAEEQYILQRIANGDYDYEQTQTRAPSPSDYYWGPTTPSPAASRTPEPYPDYNYGGYSTPAPPHDYSYHTSRTPPATTPSSLLLGYTRHDAALIDDITKKYFTTFGQKLPLPSPTTPLPVPLHGDTLVNYRRPLPPVNPDSELVRPGQGEGSLVSYQLPGNEGGHVYFLTPQLVQRPEDAHQGYVYAVPPRGGQLRYRRNKDRAGT